MTDRMATGPIGRPPYKWTDEVEAEIFDRLSKGEGLRKVCSDDWLCSVDTFYKRLDADAEFSERYARAKEFAADKLFEECLEIADKQGADVVMVDGVETINHNVIARSKLQIDTRKWMAGKLRPKVYGDKIDLSSSDGTMTPQIITRTLIDPKDNANS